MCKMGMRCQGGWCKMHCKGGIFRGLLRALFTLVILAAIFTAGAMVGAIKVIRYSGNFPDIMQPLGGMVRYGMINWNGDDWKAGTKIFGVITKIEGNKITVTDNGGKDAVIISTSGTVIVSGRDEIALGALKVGQTVNAAGSLNKDGQLEAKWISAK